MIHILSIGQQSPKWAQEVYDHYAKRLQGHWQCQLQTLPNHHSNNIEHNKKSEAKKLLAALPPTKNKTLIALDRNGKHHDSIGFAKLITDHQQRAERLVFLIGGSDGLADEILGESDHRLSLSSLTFPHVFARVILIEQIYRAWSIHHHHPYHK